MLHSLTSHTASGFRTKGHVSRDISASSYSKPKPKEVIPEYTARYIVTLLWSVILLALYMVQVFADHHPCLTKTGHDITPSFAFAFQVGFALRIVIFLNSEIINPIIRFKGEQDMVRLGTKSVDQQQYALVTNYFAFSLRLATVLVCWFQYNTVHGSRGFYCTETYGALWLEGRWLDTLIFLQLAGVIIRVTYKFAMFKKHQWDENSELNDEENPNDGESEVLIDEVEEEYSVITEDQEIAMQKIKEAFKKKMGQERVARALRKAEEK